MYTAPVPPTLTRRRITSILRRAIDVLGDPQVTPEERQTPSSAETAPPSQADTSARCSDRHTCLCVLLPS